MHEVANTLCARHAMHLQSNNEAFSRNHCCSGGGTYSEYVLVALGIQRAMRMRHIVKCGVPSCTMFLHLIS